MGTISTYSTSTSLTNADDGFIASNNQPTTSTNTQVNISPEAREKLALEQSQLGEKLAQQLQPGNVGDTEENKSDTEVLDKLIEQIQDQIKDAQQKLREIKSSSSEAVQQEQKIIESQLMSLNATLIGLLGKKLEALEESAP